MTTQHPSAINASKIFSSATFGDLNLFDLQTNIRNYETPQPMRPIRSSKRLFSFSLFFLFLLFSPALTSAQEGAETAEILFSQATIAYEEGRYSDAVRDLLKAHELDPGNTDVIYYLGLSDNAQSNHVQAASLLRKGLAIEPKNYDIQYQLGVALYGQDNLDAALKEFLAIYQAEPQRENIGYYIGLCYYQKKDYQNVLTYFQRNVSTEIRTRQLNQYYTGLTLRALGRAADAIEELTEAIKIEPSSPIVGATQQLLSALRAPRIEERRLRQGGLFLLDRAVVQYRVV